MPFDADDHGYRGLGYLLLHAQKEYLKAALCEFSEAIKLDPNGSPYYSSRGSVHQALGMYDDALSDYSKAIDIRPKADYYNSRGCVYLAQGNYDDAIADFNKAISLNPDFAWAYASLGKAYWHLGQKERAEECFKKAVGMEQDASSIKYEWEKFKAA